MPAVVLPACAHPPAAMHARLSKLPASTSDVAMRFQRRDLSYGIAKAEVAKCAAFGKTTSGSGSGAAAVADPSLRAKVQALSPPSSAEARARQEAVRERMDELRRQYEEALAPVTVMEQKLDTEIDQLAARKEQLEKELQQVTAAIKEGRAKRKKLNADRDAVALNFHDEVSTLNAEQKDLLTAVNRSEAANALDKCVSTLTQRLQALAVTTEQARQRAMGNKVARSQSALLEAVLAFLMAERPCVQFIQDRVFRTGQQLTALVRCAGCVPAVVAGA